MKKVLIIEDDVAIRENTAELLEVNRYNVFTAENGIQGFTLATKHFPDVILCDIMMPGTAGREFLKLIKEDDLTSQIPIVLFSAGYLSPKIQHQLVPGKDGILKKPFSEEDLLMAIKNSLLSQNFQQAAIL
jgi:CheY-like chemotaxis protein